MLDLGSGPFETTASGSLCQRAWKSVAPSAAMRSNAVSSTLDVGFCFLALAPRCRFLFLFTYLFVVYLFIYELRREVGYSILWFL